MRLRSLRSRLILASLLWTGGLLMLMHMFSMLVIHVVPVFRGRHSYAALLGGLSIMTVGLIFGYRSLDPFRQLQQRLNAVRLGNVGQVEGEYPAEIQPLVDNLNALLVDRDKAIKRALASAGDLAHGLKTPLALLAQEADTAASEGNIALAEGISVQVERMSRQVTFQLARARAAASGSAGGSRCLVAPCAEALIRTLLKLHASRDLEIMAEIDPELQARVQQEDLEEILGNLLDNACKWARSKGLLSACLEGRQLVITLDDDGPGVDASLRTVALQRGVRMDESAPGSGLGLAIVSDLCELYGGTLSLEDSPLGGLRARVSLPGF